MTRRSLESRLWSQVDKRGLDECWLWMGYVNSGGYGKIGVGGRLESVHRVVYSLVNGYIPEGMEVCHSCDSPACCNPSHLRVDTHAGNMRDMSLRERSWGTKLCMEDVQRIRELYANGLRVTKIAEQFPVTHQTVSRIVNNVLWKR